MSVEVPDADKNILRIVTMIGSLMSCLGASYIIISCIRIWCRKGKKCSLDFIQRLVFVLATLDLIDALAKSFSHHPVKYHGFCQIQGAMLNFAGVASCIWNLCMAFNLYMWIVHREDESKMKSRFISFCVVAFVPSVAIACVEIHQGVYEDAILWCWVSAKNKWWQFFGLYIFALIAAIGITLLVFLIRINVNSRMETNENEDSTISTAIVKKKLLLYNLSYIVIITPGIIQRVYVDAAKKYSFILSLLASIFLPLHGFVNSVIYGNLCGWLMSSWPCSDSSRARSRRLNTENFINLSDDGSISLISSNAMLSCHDLNNLSSCDDICSSHTSSIKTENRSVYSTKDASAQIFVSTFNMGEGNAPDNMSAWIPRDQDLYVIGVQECLWLSALQEKIFCYLENSRDGMSRKNGFQSLSNEGQYKMHCREIGSSNTALGYHGYIAILIFVRKSLVKQNLFYLPPSASKEVNRGKFYGLGRASNKGAVGFAFRYYDSSFAFVSCHLASDSNGVSCLKKRNKDAEDILSSLHLDVDSTGIDFPLMHHHSIVLGDLNYRLAREKASLPLVLERISTILLNDAAQQQEHWCKLVDEFDELNEVIHNRNAFVGFEEARIQFAPTYRRIRETTIKKFDPTFPGYYLNEIYSTHVAKKNKRNGGVSCQRIPSYTDRILYHSLKNKRGNLECHNYISCEDISTSDHKPVNCTFHLKLPYHHHYGNLSSLRNEYQYEFEELPRMLEIPGVFECTITLNSIQLQLDQHSFKKIGMDDFSVLLIFPIPSEDVFSQQRKIHELAQKMTNRFNAPANEGYKNSSTVSLSTFLKDGICHTVIAKPCHENMHVAIKLFENKSKTSLGQGVFDLGNGKSCSQGHFGHPMSLNNLVDTELTVGGNAVGVLKGQVYLK